MWSIFCFKRLRLIYSWGIFQFLLIRRTIVNVTFFESFLLISVVVRQNLQKNTVSAAHINACLRCCTCLDESKFCKSIIWAFWFAKVIQDYFWFQIFMDINIGWLNLILHIDIYFYNLFMKMKVLDIICG